MFERSVRPATGGAPETARAEFFKAGPTRVCFATVSGFRSVQTRAFWRETNGTDTRTHRPGLVARYSVRLVGCDGSHAYVR